LKCNSPNHGFVKVRLHLNDQGRRPIPFDHERLVDRREIAALEDDIHNRPANSENRPFRSFSASWHYGSILISRSLFSCPTGAIINQGQRMPPAMTIRGMASRMAADRAQLRIL
jgi:hypothetical protein